MGPHRRPDLVGYGLAGAGACLFATKGVVIKLAYQQGITPEALLTLRLAFSLPVYLLIGGSAIVQGRAAPDLSLALKAALVGALGYWFCSYVDFLGLKFISVQFERLILFTYPAFTVLFGALLFRQKVRPAALIGIAVSYLGLLLMFGTKLQAVGHDVTKGALLVLSAAIGFALYQLLAKQLVAPMGPRLFTCVAMMGASLATFVQFGLTQPLSSLMVGREALGYVLLLTVGATVLPTFMLNAALVRISAQANGAIGTLSPVITLLLAVAVLHEPIGLVDIAATALVLGGVGWFTLLDSRAPQGGASKAPLAKARNSA